MTEGLRVEAMAERIRHFWELRVYEKSCDLDYLVFKETMGWPAEEKFALIDQIRRSSRSVGSCIAESWGKRRYRAHFVSKLTDADSEVQETIHWTRRACAYEYISETLARDWLNRCEEVGAMLGKMIWNPGPFLLRPPPIS